MWGYLQGDSNICRDICGHTQHQVFLTWQWTTITFCLSALSQASMLRHKSTNFSISGTPRWGQAKSYTYIDTYIRTWKRNWTTPSPQNACILNPPGFPFEVKWMRQYCSGLSPPPYTQLALYLQMHMCLINAQTHALHTFKIHNVQMHVFVCKLRIYVQIHELHVYNAYSICMTVWLYKHSYYVLCTNVCTNTWHTWLLSLATS